MSLKSEIEQQSDIIENSDAIKEFLYHSLKPSELKHLDQMFSCHKGKNYSDFNFDSDCYDFCIAKIKFIGQIYSKNSSDLRLVHLKNPNISLLFRDS